MALAAKCKVQLEKTHYIYEAEVPITKDMTGAQLRTAVYNAIGREIYPWGSLLNPRRMGVYTDYVRKGEAQFKIPIGNKPQINLSTKVVDQLSAAKGGTRKNKKNLKKKSRKHRKD